MPPYALLLLLLTLAGATQVDECLKKCGVSDDPMLEELGQGTRSMGSTDAAEYAFPWIVMLEFKIECSDVKYFTKRCTGFVATDRLLVTAAHCFLQNVTEWTEQCDLPMNQFELKWFRLGKKTIKIYAGTNDLSNPNGDNVILEGETAIKDYFLPSEFAPNRIDNGIPKHDYGIITLTSKLPSNGRIRPICIATTLPLHSDDDLGTGHIGSWGATGWNVQANGERVHIVPTKMRHLALPIQDADECESRLDLRSLGFDQRVHMCAGSRSKGVLPGDSGAPILVYRDGLWYAVGILSLHTTDSELKHVYPDVFTRTTLLCEHLQRANDGRHVCVARYAGIDQFCRSELRKHRLALAKELCGKQECPPKAALSIGQGAGTLAEAPSQTHTAEVDSAVGQYCLYV